MATASKTWLSCTPSKHKQVFQRLYDTREFADVTFVIGALQKKVKAHRVIVAAHSKELAKILYAPPSNNEVILADVSAEAFEAALQFFYTGDASVDGSVSDRISGVIDLFKLSDKYNLTCLKQICRNWLREALNTENVLLLISFARQFDNPLLTKCLEIVSSGTAQVTAQMLKSDVFAYLAENELLLILETKKLNCREIDLFNALCRWAKAHQLNDLSSLSDYLLFEQMTTEELLFSVQESGFISDGTIVNVLKRRSQAERLGRKPNFLLKPPLRKERVDLCFHDELTQGFNLKKKGIVAHYPALARIAAVDSSCKDQPAETNKERKEKEANSPAEELHPYPQESTKSVTGIRNPCWAYHIRNRRKLTFTVEGSSAVRIPYPVIKIYFSPASLTGGTSAVDCGIQYSGQTRQFHTIEGKKYLGELSGAMLSFQVHISVVNDNSIKFTLPGSGIQLECELTPRRYKGNLYIEVTHGWNQIAITLN